MTTQRVFSLSALNTIKEQTLRVIWIFGALLLITGAFGSIGLLFLPETTKAMLTAYRSDELHFFSVLTDNFLTPYALVTLCLFTVAIFLLRLMIRDFGLKSSVAFQLKFIRDCIVVFLTVLFSGALLFLGYGIQGYFLGPAILCSNSVALWILLALYYRNQRAVHLTEAIGSLLYPLLFLGIGYMIAGFVPGLHTPSVFMFAGDIAVVYLIGVGVDLMVNVDRDPGEDRWKVFFKSLIMIIAGYALAHLLSWIILMLSLLVGVLITLGVMIYQVLIGMNAEQIENSGRELFCRLFHGAGGCDGVNMFSMLLSPVLFSVVFVYEKLRIAISTPWGWMPLFSFLLAIVGCIGKKKEDKKG